MTASRQGPRGDDVGDMAAPIIAERLKMGDWRNWPADEQAAIASVFKAAWARSSRQHPDEVEASEWLCAMAALGLDISVPLATWLKPPTREAALQIAHFLSISPARIVGPHGSKGNYWGCVDEATCRSIAGWLASENVGAALVLAVDEVATEDEWLLELGLNAAALVQR
jgi:hypothetical protein